MHLHAQCIGMLGRRCGIKRLPIDEFERPGPHAHDDIATSQVLPSSNDGAESEMSERTPDVGGTGTEGKSSS